MSSKYFKSLIALLAMGLLIAWGGSVVAQEDDASQYTSEEIEGTEEGPRLEVLEGYTSPGIITDSMLLNAGKDPNDRHLVARDSASGQVWDHTVADYKSSYSFTVMPLAVDGKPIGTSGAEFGIRGGSAWITGAYDPKLNNIYWGVGQPGPWDRHAHPGDNLYTKSTGEMEVMAGGSSIKKILKKWAAPLKKVPPLIPTVNAPGPGDPIYDQDGEVIGIQPPDASSDTSGESHSKERKQEKEKKQEKSQASLWSPFEWWRVWPPIECDEERVYYARCGGGSAWVTGSYDPELNNIYWGVGQPGPWDRHAHPGDNLYTNSTIVMDPDSGAIKFHFQYTPNDPYDYDGVNETVLADIDGQKVWLHADRNGHFYSIDRTNGSFNYAVPLGKVNWNRGFDPETGRPIFAYPEMDVTRDKVTEGIYPALFGGKEWNPMAYDQNTQIAYVPSFGDHSMDLQAKREKYARGELYLGIKVMKWYGGGGELRAIDARNGELVWVHNNPMPFRSSVTATAGNLVFAGDTEGYVKAFNATTEAQVWSFYTGSSVMGGVNTFTIDGKQYLTVGASQAQTGIEMFDENWKKTHQKGGHLIAFGLH